jgi:RimJ/RimL family protein N-acetyltransferase
VSYIETRRLILRTWMPGDAPVWLAIAQKPDVAQFLLAHSAAPDSIRSWIEGQIEEQDAEGFSCWPVVRKDDGQIVGRCGLHRMPEGYIEIAWAFDSDVWGAGYARESAEAVLRFTFETLRIPEVFALIDPRNAASIALAYALQMQFDRVVRAYRRDLLRYAKHA